MCVVGAGPAGLSAAVHAAARGAEVTIRERNDRCGAKLLTTGGGRCNVTNLRPAEEWPALFGRRGRFIVPALSFLDRDALAGWFASLGQSLACPDGFHLFPASNSAKAVRDALAAEASRLGVKVLFSDRVSSVEWGDGVYVVDGASRTEYDRLILACGGNSWPATGSTWDGARMAEALGHRVNPPFPGLVGLRAANLDAELAGLVLPDAEVVFAEKGRADTIGQGELLLTHGGISGPAVLDLSASAVQALDGVGGTVLRLRWLAGRDRNWWLECLAGWRKEKGGASPPVLLKEYIPFRLARWLCRHAGVDDAAQAANIPAPVRDRLAEFLGGYPAAITESEGWDKAMITRGGVDVRDIDPKTLGSRIVPELYFAGEMIDVDGPCGGYNLHWAFASGALAGVSACS